MIYFIAAGQCIKIGVTLNKQLLSRLRSIQSSNHEPIRLMRVIPFETMREAETRESEIHKLFKEIQRIKNASVGHEWFDCTEELVLFIQNEARAIDPQNIPPGLISKQIMKTVLALFCNSPS
jgi:hypothetical protein